MNPFDLPGPAFLLFYVVLGAVVLAVAWSQVRAAEDRLPPPLPLSDPYHIAWLRGGTPEAARIAVLSLVDRGLIEVEGGHLRLHPSRTIDPPGAPPAGSVPSTIRPLRLLDYPPIERAILEAAAALQPSATAVFADAGVVRACEDIRVRLEGMGLMPDPAARAQRLRWYGGAAALLIGVGVIKILVALGRGRTNIAFLLILIAAAAGVLVFLASRRRTSLGDRIVADLQNLFAALRARAAQIRAGEMTSDAVLLAAVFGLAALPADGFATLQEVYKKSTSTSGSSCGGGCGSGCGGGGGGCGGCGS